MARAGGNIGATAIGARYALFVVAFAVFMAVMAGAEALGLEAAWIGAGF